MAEQITDSDRMKRILLQAGVPNAAIATTLKEQDAMPMREFLQSLSSNELDRRRYSGMVVCPKNHRDTNKARLLFHVAAKEAILLGVACYCLSLDRLTVAISDSESSYEYEKITSSDMLFVTDFFEREAEFPLSKWQSGVVRSWIKRRLDSEGSIALLSDVSIEATSAWWPSAFASYISAHTRMFST